MSDHAKTIETLLSNGLRSIEKDLFSEFSTHAPKRDLPLIFVVCSPRVGSTLIYQLLINKFGCSFITNFVNNYFGGCPSVGIAHQISSKVSGQVGYYSEYGKTKSIFETSEASAVFANWYGGDHPSQKNSADLLSEGKKEHMIRTLSAIYGMTGETFVAKNPWNSFRIRSLSAVFDNAYFIWARRSIEKAAISDLENRYQRGSPNHWNSATTSNYKEIQKLPYWEQVVEQQYHFNLAIKESLENYAPGRFASVWYEDLCSNPKRELEIIEVDLRGRSFPMTVNENIGEDQLKESAGGKEEHKADYEKIIQYLSKDKKGKLDWMVYER